MDANGLPGQLGCEYVFNRFTSRFSFYAAKQEVCVLPDLSCSRRSSLRMKLSQQCLILRHVLAKVLSLLEKRRLRARDGTPLRRAWSEQSLRCCEEVRWTVVGSQRRRLSCLSRLFVSYSVALSSRVQARRAWGASLVTITLAQRSVTSTSWTRSIGPVRCRGPTTARVPPWSGSKDQAHEVDATMLSCGIAAVRLHATSAPDDWVSRRPLVRPRVGRVCCGRGSSPRAGFVTVDGVARMLGCLLDQGAGMWSAAWRVSASSSGANQSSARMAIPQRKLRHPAPMMRP